MSEFYVEPEALRKEARQWSENSAVMDSARGMLVQAVSANVLECGVFAALFPTLSAAGSQVGDWFSQATSAMQNISQSLEDAAISYEDEDAAASQSVSHITVNQSSSFGQN